jgi:hypothetical protein
MAFVVGDRVQETAAAPGTATVNLGGAVTGYQTFVSGIGNGNSTYYTIADQGGANWEVGIGTVTDASPDTLSRDTVIASSAGGSKVNFSTGTQTVFCTYPAENSVYSSNTPTVGYLLTGNGVGTAPSWQANSGATADQAYFISFMMG